MHYNSTQELEQVRHVVSLASDVKMLMNVPLVGDANWEHSLDHALLKLSEQLDHISHFTADSELQF